MRADLATYGKVIGGGVSIGVVAGIPQFMDALDGGQWQYGDTSFPEVGVTFFAGTFVRHPLALAAAKAVLTHLKKRRADLTDPLDRTARFRSANQLRALIEEFHAPYQLTQFSSLIQVSCPPDQKFATLLFYMLRDRGIHIYENRAIRHHHGPHRRRSRSPDKRIPRESFRVAGGRISARRLRFAEALRYVQEDRRRDASIRADVSGPFPLTEAQKEIWLAAQMSDSAAVAYNESIKLEFRGDFDPSLFREALRRVVQRHPIVLASISADGQTQQVHRDREIAVPVLDFDGQAEDARERALAALVERGGFPSVRSLYGASAAREDRTSVGAAPHRALDRTPHRIRRLVRWRDDCRDRPRLFGAKAGYRTVSGNTRALRRVRAGESIR